jgi:nitrogen fixation protein NifU and related proteins
MSFSKNDPEILREIIIDNYQNPRNFGEVLDPSYITVHMDSTSCIDDIYLQVKIVNGIVSDVKWHGKGCAISTASTSIMTDLMQGKTVAQAEAIMAEFSKMLDGKPYDEDVLGDAIAFMNVNRQPSRISCATIGWRGLQKAFAEEEKKEK